MESYSVLMSVYSKENPEYFKVAINSMINQTVKPFEIVIVEDGELTEELYAVLDYYKANYGELIKRVKLEKNSGLGIALNEGLKACSCELVARMDTDDISLPTRCEEQLKEFEKDPELTIISAYEAEFEDSPDNVVSIHYVPLTHEEIYKFGKRRTPFNHPVVMYKKSAVLSVGGYADIVRCEDYDLFGRMLYAGMKGENIGKPLLLFRVGELKNRKKRSCQSAKNAIKVVKRFYKAGYARFSDYVLRVVGYILMKFVPQRLYRKTVKKFLRKK